MSKPMRTLVANSDCCKGDFAVLAFSMRLRDQHLPLRHLPVPLNNQHYYRAGDDVVYDVTVIGNESVPIQLAQCRFPAQAISNAKI